MGPDFVVAIGTETMLIGLKLDIGFSQDEVCRQLYGDRDILAVLEGVGL